MKTYSIFVTCPRGLESVLQQELAAQNCAEIHATDGGVSAQASLAQIYAVNLHSRVAGRVLLRLAAMHYRNEQDIYRIANGIAWHEWFDSSQSFKVRIEARQTPLKSLNFAALTIKDALCDRFRDECGVRPNVDKANPDIRVHAFVNRDTCQIFLDTSGEALFKRGYRRETGEAPLRENLAAGLLLLAGYNGKQPFQDAMCGSGTLAVEAAWIAAQRAPGLMRRFAFESFRQHDAQTWQQLRQQAESRITVPDAPISASDHSREMVRLTCQHAEQAEVGDYIRTQVRDILDVRPNGENGIMVSNPPYGVRLDEIQALRVLYPQLGSWLKQYYAGWQTAWLTADREMPKYMRLTPKRKIPLFNGNLDCRLFLLDMVAGSNRKVV